VQASAKARLGGSALAQCYQQIGDDVPDVDDPQLLARAFNVTQNLIKGKTKNDVIRRLLVFKRIY